MVAATIPTSGYVVNVRFSHADRIANATLTQDLENLSNQARPEHGRHLQVKAAIPLAAV